MYCCFKVWRSPVSRVVIFCWCFHFHFLHLALTQVEMINMKISSDPWRFDRCMVVSCTLEHLRMTARLPGGRAYSIEAEKELKDRLSVMESDSTVTKPRDLHTECNDNHTSHPVVTENHCKTSSAPATAQNAVRLNLGARDHGASGPIQMRGGTRFTWYIRMIPVSLTSEAVKQQLKTKWWKQFLEITQTL